MSHGKIILLKITHKKNKIIRRDVCSLLKLKKKKKYKYIHISPLEHHVEGTRNLGSCSLVSRLPKCWNFSHLGLRCNCIPSICFYSFT